jgi:hypothetical protein
MVRNNGDPIYIYKILASYQPILSPVPLHLLPMLLATLPSRTR